MDTHLITDADVVTLLRVIDDATDAYIRGDTQRYSRSFDHADDYTLMPPYGGPTSHGYTYTEQGAAETSRFFAAGEGHFELHQSYVEGDLVVLAGVERQHGEVGGLPDQDWSLRVTLVFRLRGDRWQLVHRHADSLVREIPFEHLAHLARGLDSSPPTAAQPAPTATQHASHASQNPDDTR